MLDAVVLCLADGLIEAAFTVRGGDHVPKADEAGREPDQPLLIADRLEVLAQRVPQQPPELIGRVRIISLRCQRSVTWQASQNEQAGVGSGDWRQSGFDAQE